MFRDARALGKCLGHLKLLPNVNSPDTSQECSALHLLASAEPVLSLWAAYAMVVSGGFCGYGRQGPGRFSEPKSVKPPTCGRTALKCRCECVLGSGPLRAQDACHDGALCRASGRSLACASGSSG